MRLALASILYFVFMAFVSPVFAQENTAPLLVLSEPSGETLTLVVGGSELQTCETPCTFRVPSASPFHIQSAGERTLMSATPVRWRWGFMARAWVLEPGTVTVRFRPLPSRDKYSAPSSP